MSFHCLMKGNATLPLEFHEETGPIFPGETRTGYIPIGKTTRTYAEGFFTVGPSDDAATYVFQRGVNWDRLSKEDEHLCISELTPPRFVNRLWQLQYGRLLALSEGVNAFVLNGRLEYVTDRGTTSYPDLVDLLFAADDDYHRPIEFGSGALTDPDLSGATLSESPSEAQLLVLARAREIALSVRRGQPRRRYH